MSIEVVMPQMGESIAEGTITRWLKGVGDRVEKDGPLFEITTDKVDTEVPAPVSGSLEKILIPEGQTVPVGTVVATISTVERGQVAPSPSSEPQVAPEPSQTASVPTSDSGSGHFRSAHETTTFQRRSRSPSPPTAPSASQGASKNYLSPAVLSLAAQNQLRMAELLQIPGTGAAGRITKRDVERYLERRQVPQPPPPAAAGYPPSLPPPPTGYPSPTYPPQSPQAMVPATAEASSLPAAQEPAPLEVPADYLYKPEPEDTMVPMSAMRKKLAEHMIWSQRISAQVTSFTECDMHRIVRYRDEHRDAFEAAEGIPLTLLPFVAEATVKALKQFPIFNASVLGDQIVMKKHIHLGIAVMLEEGLIVPVVKNADEMNFVGLARAAHRLTTRARNKELSVEDVHEATFTITNPGMFGGLMGTPVIAQPQVAILSLGSVKKKPVVIEDAIAIRPIMVLALTFDHRIIDGATGFQFIERLRSNLEHFELS